MRNDHVPGAAPDAGDEGAAEALVLTGGLGSGKTTLAIAVGESLGDVPHAVIDLDWLCWCAGADVREMLTANLRAVASAYAAAGIRRLVLARALLEPSHLDAVRRALPGAAITVVRLAVSPDTARERLRARDRGATLDGHLAELEAFQHAVEHADLEHAVVHNDARPVDEVAREILGLWTTLPAP
ncbi:hypothetical protein Ssi03_56600 [Sphaerisporangium siamense]|uniref:Dephospho-CoA kinase n=1 Tax=Sphaerisporangium siamense TaxID=795645 RepID=A0A7W7GAR0_9ACTN|nr:hypothetical protein [Sphaerisporangium siamense]MBB4700256.1 dephospho-CoA kinase [Sphaerisporangium siamense]GII87670.1 hypothetical protein Ssi03_56600 [Sphaerisporangium siamense]